MDYNDAFKISHITQTTYSGKIQYNPHCIYCNHIETRALLPNDGGCFRSCQNCRKQFQARVLTNPVSNYTLSLHN